MKRIATDRLARVSSEVRIALLGTRGVPARYGGFETAVEEIGAGLAARGHDVTVYCRTIVGPGPSTYRGMRRVVLPALRRKALETLTHTGLSTLHAAIRRRPDAALVFNAANAPYVALLRAAGIPVCLHLDGHDARRAKWRGIGAVYYRWATRFGSRVAHEVVVDSRAVQRELASSFGLQSRYIAYGAPERRPTHAEVADALRHLELEPGGYHLIVARFEPENHVLDLVQGFVASSAELPLVVVGFEGYPSDYTVSVARAAASDPRIRLLGPVWEQPLLDALYAGARSYLHGHSVGGTNPSLLRAMAQGSAVIAYDCPYNRETTADDALWFDSPEDVGDLVKLAEVDADEARAMGERGSARVRADYRWADVTDGYERLALDLAARRG